LNLQIASLKMMQVQKTVLYSVFNKWFRDEFRDVLRLLPFKKKSDGTFSFDEDALVFKVGGKYMLYPH
jgi:hypothetical protein